MMDAERLNLSTLLRAIILVIARDAFNWVAFARGNAEAAGMAAEPPL